MAPPKVRITLVDAQDFALEPHELELPEVEEHFYPLTDHDARECRNIGRDELAESYVDQNIVRIEPMQPDPWTLDPASIDKQDLGITYRNDASLGIRLGSIDISGGPVARSFIKSEGIIFPVDEGGRLLMDATNTPILSAVRRDLHEQLAGRSEKRLEIAQLVAAFANIISLNGGRELPFP